MDIELDGRVRLSSAYADEDYCGVILVLPENSQVQLASTSGKKDVQQVRQLIEHYVGQHASVPALLASMTLQGFQRAILHTHPSP